MPGLSAVGELITRQLAASQRLLEELEGQLDNYDALTAKEREGLSRAHDKLMRNTAVISHELRLLGRDEERRLKAMGFDERCKLVLEWVEQLAPEQRSKFLAGLAEIVTP